jgi:nucleotide-binding universal stress UspA family protein
MLTSVKRFGLDRATLPDAHAEEERVLTRPQNGEMAMFKRILVAVDGTPTANRGLVTALALAKEHKATLHVVHVIDDMVIVPMFDTGGYVPDYVDAMVVSLRQTGRKILAKAQALAAKSGQSVQQHSLEARGQGVANAILQQARKVRADLIVMGTHGRRGMSRLVMGSDAEGVLREATVPVLLVRSPEVKRTTKSVEASSRKAPGTRKRRAPSSRLQPTVQ